MTTTTKSHEEVVTTNKCEESTLLLWDIFLMRRFLKIQGNVNVIYIYIPGTQMTLGLNGKGLLLEGSGPKIEDRYKWKIHKEGHIDSKKAHPRRALWILLPKAQSCHPVPWVVPPWSEKRFWVGLCHQRNRHEFGWISSYFTNLDFPKICKNPLVTKQFLLVTKTFPSRPILQPHHEFHGPLVTTSSNSSASSTCPKKSNGINFIEGFRWST